VSPGGVGEPLTWNVAGLLSEPAGSMRDYRVSGVTIDLGQDLRQADPIGGTVRLSRTNRGLLVEADIATSLAGECSRCLRDVEVPIEIHVEEEALPALDMTTGAPLDTSTDSDVLRLTDHHELELESPVREAVILAEPIAPLCEPDCPGLCPVCGERLAGPPHAHAEPDIDPRLEALLAFRVDGDDETR